MREHSQVGEQRSTKGAKARRRTGQDDRATSLSVLAFLLGIVAWPIAAAQPDPPHVVLLMADDMGWAQTGYYGHPQLKTPNLDAMAANGLRFDRFYAGAPSCTPTRASVLTGRSNDRTGAHRVPGPMNTQEQTLAEAFRNAGYATAHFGKWHLNGLYGISVPILENDPFGPGAFGFDYWLRQFDHLRCRPPCSAATATSRNSRAIRRRFWSQRPWHSWPGRRLKSAVSS